MLLTFQWLNIIFILFFTDCTAEIIAMHLIISMKKYLFRHPKNLRGTHNYIHCLNGQFTMEKG